MLLDISGASIYVYVTLPGFSTDLLNIPYHDYEVALEYRIFGREAAILEVGQFVLLLKEITTKRERDVRLEFFRSYGK